MCLWGNDTDDSCGALHPGRSKRSLRHRPSISSRLTPRKLRAPTPHTSRPVCSATQRYGPGAEFRRAGGEPRDGVLKGSHIPEEELQLLAEGWRAEQRIGAWEFEVDVGESLRRTRGTKTSRARNG